MESAAKGKIYHRHFSLAATGEAAPAKSFDTDFTDYHRGRLTAGDRLFGT